MTGIRRRDLLTGATLALVGGAAARAGVNKDGMPWRPDEGSPPPQAEAGPWHFFTPEEVPAIVAIRQELTGPRMPSYAWQLTDAQAAAVAAYLRNSWGRAAGPVPVSVVRSARNEGASADAGGP